MSSRVDKLFEGIEKGDNRSLSRGITLVESTLTSDRVDADELMDLCTPLSGESHRVAITGVPGVGKSTFIEALGIDYCEQGHRVAVLAVDPSSTKTGGSILGDKTRMEQLSAHKSSFIRPSAAASTLGGVARKTRESIILCEATGYDFVFVETVGVGQSETSVHSMVDTFVLLMLAGAGDELQGIKRGIMEVADVLLINKVEDSNLALARGAHSDYKSALHLLGNTLSGWTPVVDLVSAQTGLGMLKAKELIDQHYRFLHDKSELDHMRRRQNLDWFEQALLEEVYSQFITDSNSELKVKRFREKVSNGEMSPLVAARRVLKD